jgi:D-alanine-D-alanine ligase
MGVPYTGASSYTAAVCLRKHVHNGLLDRAGLPVPRFGVATPGTSLPSVGFPAICKPAAEDASVGIEQKSVVRNIRSLAARVEAMHTRWDEIVVQHFVDGREVNVGIIGDTALPIAEIDFAAMPKGMWRIVSYKSKWVTGSDEDLGSVPRCPAEIPPELTTELKRIALTAWRAVGGQGYGRVDFRIDGNGRPWLLEVNANPDIAPDAGLARMAAVAGLDYPALVHAICEHGLARSREVQRTAERWLVAQHLSGEPLAADPALLDLFAAGGER